MYKMNEFECIKTCLPFIEGYVYRGRFAVINVFGDKIDICEIYPHDSENFIIMPRSYFNQL